MEKLKSIFYGISIFVGIWIGATHAQNLAEAKLHSQINIFEGQASFAKKMEAIRKIKSSEKHYFQILKALSHPNYKVRLWLLRALAAYNKETWQALEVTDFESSKEGKILRAPKLSSYQYTFPAYNLEQPLKVQFHSPQTSLKGSISIGTEEYIFGYDQKSYYFYRKGSSPQKNKWTPYFTEGEIRGEIGLYNNFLYFFVHYRKDIYPHKVSKKDKATITCYEELFLPLAPKKAQTTCTITIPDTFTKENLDFYHDPVLYKITNRLSDSHHDVRNQALALLARYTRSGGRDYIRRFIECGIPENERFLKREGLEETLSLIYRDKILACFNRETEGGYGHYEGQFLDVTLMGRQLVGEILWEIFGKHNDDLENLSARTLAGQALQELQFSPLWLRRNITKLIGDLSFHLQKIVHRDDNIKQAIREEALKDFSALVASTLYMLGDDSHFAKEERRLLREVSYGGRFGRPLYSELELAYFYLRFKMYDKALDRYKNIIKSRRFSKNRLGILYYNMACAYSMKRQKKEAIEAFRVCIEDCEYDNLSWLNKDRDLDYIRNEPEFIRLVEILQEKQNR